MELKSQFFSVLIYFRCTQTLNCFALAPTLSAVVTSTVISGDEGSTPIAFACKPSVVENVTSTTYQFTWMKDGSTINVPDDRITVCSALYLLS